LIGTGRGGKPLEARAASKDRATAERPGRHRRARGPRRWGERRSGRAGARDRARLRPSWSNPDLAASTRSAGVHRPSNWSNGWLRFSV